MSDQGLLNEVYEFGGLNVDGKENYTILEAEGHGHYVGCLFSVYNLRRSPFWDWYGEGDDMIFVDGEPGFAAPDARRESNIPGEPTGASIAPRPESVPGANNAWPPTLHGTGTEDYFNCAWYPTQIYHAPYHGVIAGGGKNWTDPVTVYRFHIEDPIVFKKQIRVTMKWPCQSTRRRSFFGGVLVPSGTASGFPAVTAGRTTPANLSEAI